MQGVRRLLFATCALVALCGAAAAATVVIDASAAYPEGPLATPAGALVAEMGADRVSLYARDGTKRTFVEEPGCGPTSVAPYEGGYLVLCHLAGAVVVYGPDGALSRRFEGLGNPNDSFADGRGGVYFSSPGLFSKRTRPAGRVMYLSSTGDITTVADQLWYPNGVYVDQTARALYVSEHLARRILRYDIAADGQLGAMTVFADIDAIDPPLNFPAYREAGPDGLERAPNGDLVVAIYGEGRLLQIRPDGKLRRVIAAPAQYVTNIAFEADGGAVVTAPKDNLNPPFPGVVARLPAQVFR